MCITRCHRVMSVTLLFLPYLVVVTHPDNLAHVGRVGGLLHLRRQEVRESLAGEPVDVVDWIRLYGQGVHVHPSTSRYRCLSNLRKI